MNLYLFLKITHVVFVVLSLLGIVLRGVWMMRDSAMLQQRWVRTAPHIIDTLLLVAALAMCYVISLNPLRTDWLVAKLLAVTLYIVLGAVALKRGKTKTIRVGAWLMSLLVFAYIVAVAVTKQAFPIS